MARKKKNFLERYEITSWLALGLLAFFLYGLIYPLFHFLEYLLVHYSNLLVDKSVSEEMRFLILLTMVWVFGSLARLSLQFVELMGGLKFKKDDNDG